MKPGYTHKMFNKRCPKCGLLCMKTKEGNWLTDMGYLYMSHNIGCDNKYLEEGTK